MDYTVFYDFTDPFSYLAIISLIEAKFQTNDPSKIQFRSFELNKEDNFREDYTDYLMKMMRIDRNACESAFNRISDHAKSLQVNIDFNHLVVTNTRKAHKLALCATEENKELDFILDVFDKYFNQHLDITDENVLLDAFQSVGLDETLFYDCLQSTIFDRKIEEDRALALEYEINNVPVVFIDSRKLMGQHSVAKYINTILEEK